MSLAHLLIGLLEFLPDAFFTFTSVECPRCYVEMRRLPKPNKQLFRCPSCDELWVRRDKKLQPFVTRG
jgi:transposase